MMTPTGEERAAAADSSASALRACFGQALACRLDQHTGRLSWDAQRLARHQRDQLRALLAAAVSCSPFHARRLGGICPARFELSQLAELPVMTKEQMMASFDELVTDRRLTRARAERQLVASADGPGLLYDQYVCLASGGSWGLRGLFVQTVGEYAEFAASVLRRAMARASAAGVRSSRFRRSTRGCHTSSTRLRSRPLSANSKPPTLASRSRTRRHSRRLPSATPSYASTAPRSKREPIRCSSPAG